jgi:hypothetical protein
MMASATNGWFVTGSSSMQDLQYNAMEQYQGVSTSARQSKSVFYGSSDCKLGFLWISEPKLTMSVS